LIPLGAIGVKSKHSTFAKASWLASVSDGTNSAAYSYLAISPLVWQIGFKSNTMTRMGEKTADYTYDPIGEVIADLASEVSGGAARMNEQLHYAFDPAGNLNYRTNNTMIENFEVNTVNELTANTNGGKLTVIGTTMTAAATNVTVNSSNALRYGDATFAATNMPVTTTYTAIASDKYGRHSTNAVTVSILTNTTYQYDGNGNLTNDGLRSFAYDNENQLIQVWVSNHWFSQFSYDGKMRRRIRQEYTWQSGAWVQTNEVYYVYDGNVVIQERSANNIPTTTYTRGNDLSSSLQGAGGIGGLLSMTLNTAPGPSTSNSYYYHSDGIGNVTMLLNPWQYIVAKYLYDAFGNTLSAAGSLARANLYRFSSKEAHPNSGLVYYLYRYYDPNLQRWPNRDPIEEVGGINLYEFVRNAPLLGVDYRGLNACTDGCLAAMNSELTSLQGLATAVGLGGVGGLGLAGHQTPSGGQRLFCFRGGPTQYAQNLGRGALGGIGLGILTLEVDAYSSYLGCVAGCSNPNKPSPPSPPSPSPSSCPPPPPQDCSENAPPVSVSK
jgi:RHS repeat-associated protein